MWENWLEFQALAGAILGCEPAEDIFASLSLSSVSGSLDIFAIPINLKQVLKGRQTLIPDTPNYRADMQMAVFEPAEPQHPHPMLSLK